MTVVLTEYTNAEKLFHKLCEYLCKYPKHDGSAYGIGCEDVKIINDVVVNDGERIICPEVYEPGKLVNDHWIAIKRVIEEKEQQGLICVVRLYPEVKGTLRGLQIRTRLQFGKADEIIFKLLPARPHEF